MILFSKKLKESDGRNLFIINGDRSMFSYFKLRDAVDDFSCAFDNKEKAVAGAKLVGKTLFNVGLFAGKMGADIIKDLPNQNIRQIENHLKNPDLTNEQREKLERMLERARDSKHNSSE